MHIRIHMVKVISLSEEAYRKMKSLKQQGQSFSDVVLKLASKSNSLGDLFGKWPGTSKEAKDIKEALSRQRKKFKTREAKF